MPVFKSIIVLDLETTGLPRQQHNQTRITELAVVACEVSHCMTSNHLPRTLHKLVFCINPMKKIDPGAADVSGLTNELLEHVGPFDASVVSSLQTLVNHLPAPVCVVAHNGNKFDFPILRREIESCKMFLGDDLYCADSLLAFRELFPKSSQKKSRLVKELADEREDRLCLAAMEKLEESSLSVNLQPPTTPVKRSMQEMNETTPKHKPRFLREVDENSPTALRPTRLNMDALVRETGLSAPLTYRLKDVYMFLHGHSFPEAHRAEHDALALLSCIIACRNEFFDWINEKSVLYNSIKPLF